MCKKNFKVLKNILYISLILKYFDFDKAFIFYVDENK